MITVMFEKLTIPNTLAAGPGPAARVFGIVSFSNMSVIILSLLRNLKI